MTEPTNNQTHLKSSTHNLPESLQTGTMTTGEKVKPYTKLEIALMTGSTIAKVAGGVALIFGSVVFIAAGLGVAVASHGVFTPISLKIFATSGAIAGAGLALILTAIKVDHVADIPCVLADFD